MTLEAFELLQPQLLPGQPPFPPPQLLPFPRTAGELRPVPELCNHSGAVSINKNDNRGRRLPGISDSTFLCSFTTTLELHVTEI